MSADNFYCANGVMLNENSQTVFNSSGLVNSGVQYGASMLNVDRKQVFNSGGPGTQMYPSERPFKSAAGNAKGFYGADGDTSVATTSTTTTQPANPTATIGINLPTMLVLAAGFVIGMFYSKGEISM